MVKRGSRRIIREYKKWWVEIEDVWRGKVLDWCMDERNGGEKGKFMEEREKDLEEITKV